MLKEAKAGAPGRTRTCNQRIRSPVLYPIELQAHNVLLVYPKKRSLKSKNRFLSKKRTNLLTLTSCTVSIICKNLKDRLTSLMIMSQSRLLDAIKDIALFALLIFLLSVTIQRLKKFVSLHGKSMIHELDTTFFNQIKEAQRQAGLIAQFIAPTATEQETRRMQQITRLVQEIERKYTRNAPTLALLGPIGTTSIVVKEQQLKRQLNQALFNMRNLLRVALDEQPDGLPKEGYPSIESLIDGNKKLIKTIQT